MESNKGVQFVWVDVLNGVVRWLDEKGRSHIVHCVGDWDDVFKDKPALR